MRSEVPLGEWCVDYDVYKCWISCFAGALCVRWYVHDVLNIVGALACMVQFVRKRVLKQCWRGSLHGALCVSGHVHVC